MAGSLSQLKALNDNLSVNQKLSIVTLGAVILFGMLGFVYLLNQEDYQPLMSNLSPDDAQQVINQLQSRGIRYKLDNGGRTILVPIGSVDSARLEIASSGLMDRGSVVGFEIFDEGSWNITNFAEKVNFQRALEGELAQTIHTIAGIRNARVHLALGKESLFADESTPATGSVVVGLGMGGTLGQDKVAAIRNIVARAVSGMDPNNVSVVSTDGQLLSSSGGGSQMVNDQQLNLRKELEQELSRKVLAILERPVGASKVEVRTSLDLDYKQVQQKEILKDPVLLSEQKARRPGAGAGSVGGIAGTAANQGAGPQSGSAAGDGPWTDETRNFEFSTIERLLTSPGGSILAINMAVLIDDKTIRETDAAGDVTEKRTPWTPEELEKLKSLVASTIGYRPQRGDQLTLENVSFQTTPSEPVAIEGPGFLDDNRQLLMQIVRYAGIVGVFLLFYWMVFRPVKRRVFTFVEGSNKRALAEAAAQKALKAAEQLSLTEGNPEATSNPAADRLRRDLLDVAKRDPEAVSSLVSNWMSEGV